MALSKGCLCRVPAVRHSAKSVLNFFLKNFLFAECIHRSARQRNYKKKLNLCRVPDLGHSAKKFFKKSNLCRVPNSRRSAKKAVTERCFAGSLCRVYRFCRESGTRQRSPLPSALFCRVRHSAKKVFVECPI